MKSVALRILEWFLHPDWVDDITGDLEEIYARNEERSHTYAELKFLGQALMLLRPSLMRPFQLKSNNNIDMFKNYLKISSRSLMRHKSSTAINVFGLAIGLAVFLLINQYVRFERSYDAFYENSENLYRLTTTALVNGEPEEKDAMVTYSIARELHKKLPEIQNYTTTYQYDPGMVYRIGEKTFQEKRVVSGDSNFLEIFTYDVLAGNKATMLSKPNQLVLTEDKAIGYFGSVEEAMGKNVEILNEFEDESFIVTGVIQNIPTNTHYKFDVMISDPSLADRFDYEQLGNNNYYSYITLDPQADPQEVQEKIQGEFLNYYDEEDARWEIGLVTDIHLKSDFTFEPDINGSAKAINFLNYISMLILFIAWVNYINLSTARALDRAKEVGLRKVVGAYKGQLIWQFLTEALLVNLVAAIMAVVFSQLVLPLFNQLIGREVMTNVWDNPSFLTNLLIFFAIGTFVSGFYPALVLSRYKPTQVLKGKFRNSKKGTVLRKGLVIVQFAASIILVAGTLIIQKQVSYMLGKDIGISTDQIVTFTIPEVQDEETANRSDLFKERLLTHAAIEEIGRTSNVPGGAAADINTTTADVYLEGRSDALPGTTYLQFADEFFIETVELEILDGRNFKRDLASDSVALIANEAFVRRFDVQTGEAVNKTLQFGSQDGTKFTLVGVVKDFNRTSLKSAVEPTIYVRSLYNQNFLMKTTVEGVDDALLHLEQTWDEFYPEMPLDYTFLDDRFSTLYMEDQRFGSIFLYFSVFSIIIALLGLFGLAAFISIQRTKEVGIRKALGASVSEIIGMFIKEFAVLVAIAALVGFPLVYFSMESWLSNYAFHIEFPWELGVLGVILVGICAIVTVTWQVYRVARTEPAESLKYE